MGLEKLVTTDILTFSREYSSKDDSGMTRKTDSETKLASSDVFEEQVKILSAAYEGKPNISIIANAGGSDAILSLYSGLWNSGSQTSHPHLIVIDRKQQNLDNLWFRMMLAKISEDRGEYLANMFGFGDDFLDQFDEYKKSVARFEKLSEEAKKDKTIAVPESPGPLTALVESYMKDFKYDAEKHIKMITKGLKTIEADPAIRKMWMETSERLIRGTLANNGYFKTLSDGLVSSMKNNPETHYLSSDDLLRALSRSINLEKGQTYLHSFREDIGDLQGMNAVKRIISDYSIKRRDGVLFDVAFLPNLMRGMLLTIPFLKDNVDQVVYCQKDPVKDQRSWVTKNTSRLQMPTKTKGIEKYDEMYRSRVHLDSGISPIEDLPGVPKTLFISNLSIGYAYADRKALEQIIDYANAAKVENIVIGGGIYGSFFFRQNKRRRQKHHEFESLDEQLEEFKRIRGLFNGNIMYVPGEHDYKICEELLTQYIKEKNQQEAIELAQERKNMKSTSGGHHFSVSDERAEYNSRNDYAKHIIDSHVYPYLLRLGWDATRFYDEDSESMIVQLVDIFTKIDEGRKLSKEDEAFLNKEALSDSEAFSIYPSISKLYRKKGKETLLEVFGNTKFSGVTQYKDPSDVLEELVKMKQNGAIPSTESGSLQVDTGSAFQFFKLMGKDAIMFVPDMVDDSRYNDHGFLPRDKLVQPDLVHKRFTIRRSINHPGGWIYTGNHNEIFTLNPLFPKVIENMESVQKSGKGYDMRKVLLIHDTQLNSITERPAMFVKALDYAIYEEKCDIIDLVGDLIQGRNYKGMPIENAILGDLTTTGMEMAFVNLVAPYLTHPNIKMIKGVPGNHEWNTDVLEFGTSFMTGLEAFVRYSVKDRNPGIEIDFPKFTATADGDVMRAPFSYMNVNGYGIISGHMYSQHGSGKGNSTRPTTHLASWMRNMGELSKYYDIGFGAHYHIIEALCQDNKFVAINGAYAGESGYEFMRQYGGGQPMGAIYVFPQDGSFQAKFFSEEFLKSYKIQNPLVKDIGVDAFIRNAFTTDISDLSPERKELQRFYRRDLVRRK